MYTKKNVKTEDACRGKKNLNYAKENIILEDFKKLIEFYGSKSKNDDLAGDLTLFLWELISKGKAISKRYTAVAIRNEYIRLSKRAQSIHNNEGELYENISSSFKDIDATLDLRDALKVLTKKQRDAVVLHHIAGLSFAELAEKHGTTRQAEHRLERRASERMKEFFES